MIDLLYVYKFSLIDNFSRAFFIVSDRIGIDWPKLIAYLDASIDTAVIRSQNPFNVFDQARQALQMWSQKYPANATTKNLIDALKNIGRNDIVTAIKNSK